MATEVKVPTLGESVTEATVGQWLKKPGEAVALDEPIVSLETDKVAVDVPAPVAGTLGDIIAKEGDTVNVGALLALINEGAAAAAAPAAAPAAKAEAAAPAPAASAPAPAASDDEEGGNLTLSPAVRRLVLEHGLDPSKIKGTGKDGRLTKDDVTAAVAAGTAKAAAATAADSAPAAAAPASGPGRAQERVKMTRLRQTVAKRLKEAQNNAALLTTFNDVDMSAVIEARAKYKDLFEKKHGVRLGFMGFFTKAVCMALKDIPGVNAQIEGDEIVYNDFCDISVAVSAPTGLVVPVIRNAESMSVATIEKTIGDFGRKAKEGKLTMEDMKGGTFTISNGGVFGSLMSTPIINPPQSAVLGLHRIEDRPVVRDGQVVVRPMMYLALSYDHRLIDGREAVTFLVAVKNAIEDPTRLLIDL
ncbi:MULTISPECIES: 2-oxoglutarate dehydrogenase complex dihydrolipoyllysine-residue succinyltransferase [unclassified Sphingobium]|uniref:2-oxoglutarate dehydrogenase complex dihydrolipoyllysine-residue succinyltransferase n=1 Tax=unclassified Sphingobium TaxID=2611147 RepID=UPI000D162AFE|nr:MULTISPECIES: 2-oxoglutarate dehydrogenase complex dihydrolipoyllysine-residue succinyltransferase [unclassified Sphingobium]MBG6117487.1 2-oxoglutarate dehydrogenase E2 component (dihydrolipoamide succinyltransferase) [Sphingobium sp. JAI105]PSO12562.1 dihydrolipoyllysine-residue succinyltransferase [Sphingobium sp. AEW4]TWD09738.1 2-oxoglutarate dehydrogenase E2 component [Sphingobium sp. AEW010]TWD26409.1 2-oxoglutarate dehydrogenase E2 component [Sphingobium sp. AEW013]TWD27822.1 2-oxog